MKHVFNTLLALSLLWIMGTMLGQRSSGTRFGRLITSGFAQANNEFKVACGGADDSAAVQIAGVTSGATFDFLAGETCAINAGVTVSANNVVWHGNGASFKRLSTTTDTTHYALAITGSNFQMDGFVNDLGGVQAGPDSSHFYFIAASGAGAKFVNNIFRNTGT